MGRHVFRFRFGRTGAWLVWPLILLLLAGCSSTQNSEKKVIQIQIRPNRVSAQPAHVNAYFTPAAVSPATPEPLPPTSTKSVQKTPQPIAWMPTPPSIEATPLPTPTPTPIPLPIGRPERIVIPAVDIDTPVVPVTSDRTQIGTQWFEEWRTASYAAGYHEGSALLGQRGNTVISGHNNIEGAVFRDLYKVEPGNLVHIYAKGFRYDYVVVDRFLLREAGVPLEQRLQNASWILPTVDERVTLVSCWPPTGNTYRVIVIAKPVREVAQDR